MLPVWYCAKALTANSAQSIATTMAVKRGGHRFISAPVFRGYTPEWPADPGQLRRSAETFTLSKKQRIEQPLRLPVMRFQWTTRPGNRGHEWTDECSERLLGAYHFFLESESRFR